MHTTWTFHSAGQIVFGPNATGQLPEILVRLKLRRLLVVTDENLVSAGLVDSLRGLLSEAGVVSELFTGGKPEPCLDTAYAAVSAGRDFRPDGVLGLGGGSNLDLAKMTALILTHGGTPSMYFGEGKVPGPIMPLLCLPTTSGTGSEVSSSAVLTDTENQIKVSTLSQYLRPMVAIVDPRLTHSCPPKVTADSGIDALVHAIEAYTAVLYSDYHIPPTERSTYQGKNPLGDMLAEKAIQLIGRHLRQAVNHGRDREARDGMALASTLAGLAFSNVGVALVHALEYPLGGATHCSHGAGNGLLLPYVMRFNLPSRTHEFAQIARWLGEDTTGLNDQQAAERAITAVEKLRADIHIPHRLSELGAKAEQLPGFAEKAFQIKRLMRINPREASQADLEGILREAL